MTRLLTGGRERGSWRRPGPPTAGASARLSLGPARRCHRPRGASCSVPQPPALPSARLAAHRSPWPSNGAHGATHSGRSAETRLGSVLGQRAGDTGWLWLPQRDPTQSREPTSPPYPQRSGVTVAAGPTQPGARPHLREGAARLELLGAASAGPWLLCTMVVTKLPTAALLLLQETEAGQAPESLRPRVPPPSPAWPPEEGSPPAACPSGLRGPARSLPVRDTPLQPLLGALGERASHSLTDSFIHSLPPSFTNSFVPSFPHSFAHSFARSRALWSGREQDEVPAPRGHLRRAHLLLAVKLGARETVPSLLRGPAGVSRAQGLRAAGGEGRALGWSSWW